MARNLTAELGFGNEHLDFAVPFDTSQRARLWHRLGLASGLGATQTPEFTGPFLDVQVLTRTAIGVFTPLITSIGRRTRLIDAIEKRAVFPSSRISRSVKDD